MYQSDAAESEVDGAAWSPDGPLIVCVGRDIFVMNADRTLPGLTDHDVVHRALEKGEI